jgi:hypothetical protein
MTKIGRGEGVGTILKIDKENASAKIGKKTSAKIQECY